MLIMKAAVCFTLCLSKYGLIEQQVVNEPDFNGAWKKMHAWTVPHDVRL